MSTSAEITRRETRGSALLWFGVLGAPTAWALGLLSGYSLEEWFACSPAATDQGEVLGLGVRALGLVIPIAMTGVAVAAGLVAGRCLRAIPKQPGDHITARARWMAWAGIFNSVLYGLAIAVTVAAPLLLGVCETTP